MDQELIRLLSQYEKAAKVIRRNGFTCEESTVFIGTEREAEEYCSRFTKINERNRVIYVGMAADMPTYEIKIIIRRKRK